MFFFVFFGGIGLINLMLIYNEGNLGNLAIICYRVFIVFVKKILNDMLVCETRANLYDFFYKKRIVFYAKWGSKIETFPFFPPFSR